MMIMLCVVGMTAQAQLTEDQITAKIDYMIAQGASDNEIVSYLEAAEASVENPTLGNIVKIMQLDGVPQTQIDAYVGKYSPKKKIGLLTYPASSKKKAKQSAPDYIGWSKGRIYNDLVNEPNTEIRKNSNEEMIVVVSIDGKEMVSLFEFSAETYHPRKSRSRNNERDLTRTKTKYVANKITLSLENSTPQEYKFFVSRGDFYQVSESNWGVNHTTKINDVKKGNRLSITFNTITKSLVVVKEVGQY